MDKIIAKAKKIKLIATDIDGVWTDSMMYYNATGVVMKSFSTYDGMGADLLLKHGFIIAMITSEYENIDILKARAKKLNIKEVYIHEKEKLSRLNYLIQKYNLSLTEVAYIGDDINDLECLQSVGVSAMPQSSPILNRFNPDIVTNCIGGNGAFREFVDSILFAQDIIPKY